MLLDPAPFKRLANGELALFRYATWRRAPGLAPLVAGAEAAAGFGTLQPLDGGHAAATAPGRWVWFALAGAAAPEAAPDSVRTDLSAAVVGYAVARSQLDALLRRHAPAALDADLLAPGFRRFGFATWGIELAILPDRPPLVIVPRGHADNFAALAGGPSSSRSPGGGLHDNI
jgi:hypothetical protein